MDNNYNNDDLFKNISEPNDITQDNETLSDIENEAMDNADVEFQQTPNDDDTQKQDTNHTYYREEYKKKPGKKAKRGATLRQLIAVSLISSILGGGIVFIALQFVAPAIQPSVNSYFGRFLNDNNLASVSLDGDTKETIIRQIQIEETDSPIVAIAEKVSPSIVGVRINSVKYDFFFGTNQSTEEGSGIIISKDGYIMTNNHVIQGALEGSRGTTMAEGTSIEVILPARPDEPYKATVIGRDEKTDLAVIKIEETGLPAAELGTSADLQVGELAVAIGNPGGLDYMGSVTAGIISGLNRTIQTSDGKKLTLIQTDAAINPGNSGGALVNSKGQVIGINTIKVAASGYEGLGFAIPIDHAREITESLIEFKYVKGRPFLGISADLRYTQEVADRNQVPMGVLVGDVLPLGAAQEAGIKTGDIITHFDGERIESFAQMEELKNNHKPGDVIKIEVFRKGESIKLDLVLGEDKG